MITPSGSHTYTAFGLYTCIAEMKTETLIFKRDGNMQRIESVNDDPCAVDVME